MSDWIEEFTKRCAHLRITGTDGKTQHVAPCSLIEDWISGEQDFSEREAWPLLQAIVKEWYDDLTFWTTWGCKK